MSFHVPNKFRVTSGRLASDNSIGNNGAFWLRSIKRAIKSPIFCIASDGEGWEHVSVSFGSHSNRTPTWTEMSFVKSVFWDDDDCVMQLHPPRSEYVNNHDYCLHLWRPIDASIPLPDSILVGLRDLTPSDIKRIVEIA